MGWNTSALFVRDRSVAEVVDGLRDAGNWQATGERVPADEASTQSAGGRLYLAENGGWCHWDPDQRLVLDIDRLLGLGSLGALKGTRALALLFSSVSSTYGLWVFDDGVLVRSAIHHEGEMVQEFGDPLPVESRLEVPSWGPDEDFLWGVFQEVTDLRFDSGQLFEVYVDAAKA
ncbi:hypothetical protein ACGFNU_04230 [Spirillospora sp. NPDC048911]|uniref:hypothetical protein n=1 Tax=Spirillospora sp. NPDC048911 TaxID=3364527 RepID=UPI003710825C